MSSGRVHEIPVFLSRHAVSPREVCRAGEIWRLCQDAAVQASTEVGWTPERYMTEGVAFVMREMTVLHHREARYGEALDARTWVRDFRRGIISHREVRLQGSGGINPIARATQQWVHVTTEIRPRRASAEMLESFRPAVVEDDPSARIPEVTETLDGEDIRFDFRCWHSWMDPLDHVNHPSYIDWCDEALYRRLASRGVLPHQTIPVAECLRWRAAVVAEDAVTVTIRLVGTTAEGDAVLDVGIGDGAGRSFATGTTVRRLVGDSGRLVDLLLG